jgi:histidine triad (HIT) family protein
VRAVSRDPDCAFCEIVEGAVDDVDVESGVVFSDEVAVAFLDRSPLFVGHVLVVPRCHVVTLAELPTELVGPYYRRVQHLSARIPDLLGAEGTFVANNNIVSQSVAHLHVHVVPRTKGDGLRGFFWPRRRYEPGQAAELAVRMRSGLADFSDV